MLVGGLIIGFITQKMFMASIIKKTYHIRNYDNIEYEMKKKMSNNNGNGKIDINIDDGNLTKRNGSLGSDPRRIYPINETQKEGGEEEEEE